MRPVVAAELNAHAIVLDQGKIVVVGDLKSILFDTNLIERHRLETTENKLKLAGAFL